MLEKIKLWSCVIIAIVTIVGTIFAVERYFAKTSAVDKQVNELKNNNHLTNERLDIAITDDQIFQQEQTVQRIRDIKVFEQKKREPEMSQIEKETLKKAEDRLKELKKRKEDKLKSYEKSKKSNGE